MNDRRLPAIHLKRGEDRRLLLGHPWAYSNELQGDNLSGVEPGTMVRLLSANGRPLGLATFNPHTLIAARLMTRDATETIGARFFAERLERALAIRERLFDQPYYRLAHAEADALPGLVIDRFGPAVVVQANTAGNEALLPHILAALDQVVAPDIVVIGGDDRARVLEGLEPRLDVVKGALGGAIEIEENRVRYLVDLAGGQKTGWFYDQRDNRAFVASLAKGATVLDAYCYAGGFALAAATAGARSVIGVDRSEAALALARAAATLNSCDGVCSFVQAEAFADLERRGSAGERFDVVIADPPAFAKSRREAGPAKQGYRKLTRLCASLVASRGFLAVASCSYHVGAADFAEAVARGLADAGRSGRILRQSGAGPDHPVHPMLPETAYLKFLALALD